MPKTPTGAKRPADVTRNAVMVMKIATGEQSEMPIVMKPGPSKGGAKGGPARAVALSPAKRKAIAKKAAKTRWKASADNE